MDCPKENREILVVWGGLIVVYVGERGGVGVCGLGVLGEGGGGGCGI